MKLDKKSHPKERTSLFQWKEKRVKEKNRDKTNGNNQKTTNDGQHRTVEECEICAWNPTSRTKGAFFISSSDADPAIAASETPSVESASPATSLSMQEPCFGDD